MGYSFPLQTGTDTDPHYYKYRVKKLDQDPSGGHWWGGWIIDSHTQTEYMLGKILSDGDFISISSHINFVEYYGASLPSCDDVPKARVFFSLPAVNGVPHSYVGHSKFHGWDRMDCVGGNVSPGSLPGRDGALFNFGGSLSACTASGQDPWASGAEILCCSGLHE